MRALVLLLLVGLSFFLVVTYYPSSTVEGADLGQPAAPDIEPVDRAPIPKVIEEKPAPVAKNPFLAEPEPSQVLAQDADDDQPESEDWLTGVNLGTGLAPGELAVAAALVHGGIRGVGAALSKNREFPSDKALLVEAMALSLERKFPEALERARRLDSEALSEREQDLLKLGLQGDGLGSIAASESSSPLVLAMEVSLCAFSGEEALRKRDYARAAQAFSSAILAELDSPWEADAATLKRWSESLHDAQKHSRWNPKGDWPGVELVVQDGESPIAVRLRYLKSNPDTIMCTGLFQKANRISGHIIQPGQSLRIPTDATSVLVDLSACWALFLMGDEVVGSWPVGIGRGEHDTPSGEYTAGNKLENPPWMRVGQAPVPFGDARNPLGTRWIGWFREGVPTSYGLHGTNEPESIGTPSSLGCIRFHNEDIELLYDILPVGSPIYVRD